LFENDPAYKRLAKYSVLLTIKESYLFIRNWLGMIFHPFKTLRSLLRERDYSQILLVIGFPLHIFIGGLGLIWFSRRLIKATPGQWWILTQSSVAAIFFTTTITFFYLAFWLYKIWKLKK
jgi:uncharacterized membrane protein YpjA